jgi:ElaB/YqjD/DUF883 family membrane-anchored ribosome-binding protein
MAYTSENPSSAEIEREIAEDRRRIGNKLDAIQQRMSPGQLVDEVISYAKSSGGGAYAANLSAAVKNNPVPMALVGVGLAWLMAGPKTSVASYAMPDDHDFPLAIIQGEVRRSGPVTVDGENRYSHFTDSAGTRYKALTDATGRRAGHFVDESGKTFRGFADASGRHYDDLRDEAGKLFDEASGWISGTWQDLTRSAGRTGDAISLAGRSALDTGAQLNDAILKHFRDQPLVGGALAFAVGAAIGAALPHTKTEDEAFGSASDDVKSTISRKASDTLDKSGKVATGVYAEAVSIATDIHDTARDRIQQGAQDLRQDERQSAAGDSKL